MRNPLARGKEGMMKKFVEQSGAIDALAHIIAEIEMEMLQEVDALHDDFDLEFFEDLPEIEQREEQLKGFALAQTSGDLESFYVEDVLDDVLQNSGKAKGYLGMEQDEWEDQIEKWAASVRKQAEEQGRDLDLSPREYANLHVLDQFGVSIDQFEQLVVSWDKGKMGENILAGNFQAVVAGIRYLRQQKNADDLDVDDPDLLGVEDDE